MDNVEHVTGPRTPTVPYGHPDLLIRRAVCLGILDREDEQPYIDIRLGHRAVEPVAVRLGITVDALRMRLGRIDNRIADALARGLLTGITSPHGTSDIVDRVAARTGHAAASRQPPAAGLCGSRRRRPPLPDSHLRTVGWQQHPAACIAATDVHPILSSGRSGPLLTHR